MFKKFNFKIQKSVICIVSIMLAIQFSLTYILYFSIFKEDFNQKSKDLSNQIINHISLRLQVVEEATGLFCDEFEPASALNTFDNSMIRNMRNLIISSNDIRGCFITGGKHSYYYNSQYKHLFKDFNTVIELQPNTENTDGFWTLYETNTEENPNYLLYCHIIRDKSSLPIGFLCVDVSTEKLYQAVELFDTNMLNYITVYISSSDRSKSFHLQCLNENSGIDLSEIMDNSNKYITSTSHYSDDIFVNVTSSVDYIGQKLRPFIFVMVTIFIVVLIVLFVVLRTYSKHLIKSMTDLNKNMHHFIENDIIGR